MMTLGLVMVAVVWCIGCFQIGQLSVRLVLWVLDRITDVDNGGGFVD